MTDRLVIWAIDVDTDTPLGAALEAEGYRRDARVYHVIDKATGEVVEVDLDDITVTALTTPPAFLNVPGITGTTPVPPVDPEQAARALAAMDTDVRRIITALDAATPQQDKDTYRRDHP